MAQIDTNLGWTGKDIYLKETSTVMGTLSKVSNPEFDNQPLPYDTQIPSTGYKDIIMQKGMIIASGENGYSNSRVYCLANKPDCFICRPGTGMTGWTGIASSSSSRIYLVFIRGTEVTAQGYFNTSTASGSVYYGSYTRNQAYNTYYIPRGKTAQEYCADFTVSATTYYKLNAGYAVCCFARYTDTNGNLKRIPVLISTVQANTAISVNGTSEAPSIMLTKQYEGLLFYMKYIITDTDSSLSTTNVTEAILTNYPVLTPSGIFNALMQSDWANVLVPNSPDPYGTPSEPGGSDGEEDSREDVDFPLPPSIGAVNSGFLTLFLPSLIQLNGLANYMWTNDFDLDTIRKMFANPMDAILGCYILPISPAVTGSKAVRVAGIAIPNTTWNYTVEEYITLTCGSITIPKDTGSYLDYMTKLQIFLPYIGFREISPDDCMGKTLTLQYNIHVLSGACVASLKCGSTVLYNWAGQCSMQIPVNGTDLSSAISAAIGIAASTVSLAVTNGATAPMVAGTIASAAVNSFNLKPHISRGGSISGAAGFLAKQLPYIVRSNPVVVNPGRQNEFIGYPSYVTMNLGTLTGYNEVDSIHLENVPGTDAELSEIENLLKSGVIF